jgi:hypothetical protein
MNARVTAISAIVLSALVIVSGTSIPAMAGTTQPSPSREALSGSESTAQERQHKEDLLGVLSAFGFDEVELYLRTQSLIDSKPDFTGKVTSVLRVGPTMYLQFQSSDEARKYLRVNVNEIVAVRYRKLPRVPAATSTAPSIQRDDELDNLFSRTSDIYLDAAGVRDRKPTFPRMVANGMPMLETSLARFYTDGSEPVFWLINLDRIVAVERSEKLREGEGK